MANQPYLDLSRIIHEYEACETRYIWREVFGRKHVTKEMFLKAIEDDKVAKSFFFWIEWFATNALIPSEDRIHFFEFLFASVNKADAKWREDEKNLRGKGADIYWQTCDKIYAECHRACLTLLCELWFAQEEKKLEKERINDEATIS